MQKQSDIGTEIRRMDEQFTTQFAAHDAEALSKLYTDDALVLAPGEDMIQGQSALKKYWKRVFDSGLKSTKLEPISVERFGDIALDAGRYTMVGEDGKTLDEGKYLIAWKYANGNWRIHRDAWTSKLPVH
ncbi:SgcJ/EcaC family oxidoreductase [Gammaproteobacteria bacterium AB-CW1]|uniref:SgcJ/EcaC family oxidoreductase n=1 Tax=Natronospira elongata TaxID=3110268 RepID=A0AAP6JGV2_9GAMM|nr:SgcJ/EcaC family oxidoreductase [Gammaproteobacteria bacterium AB-CW1]